MPALPAPPLARTSAQAVLVALLGAALLTPAASASARGDIEVVELPAPACDVCAPGKPPPPAAVQEQVRRINEDANWRRQPSTGDTIPLGPTTRIWLQRAWASGRLQPGVANVGSSGAGRGGVAAMRSGARQQPRASLAARSRRNLADRRSTRDGGSRSRRGGEEASAPRTSSFGTGSRLGSDRSANTFGTGRSSFSDGMGQ